MAKTQTLLDLDSMVDEVLDDINETPDYCNPPAGDYKLISKDGKITKFEQDDGTEVQSIVITIAVVETLELVSDEEPPVADGSLFTTRFQGTVEGVGTFKKEIRKMSGLESTNGMSIGSAFELLESGLEFNGRIGYSTYKGRDGVIYTSLRMKILPQQISVD